MYSVRIVFNSELFLQKVNLPIYEVPILKSVFKEWMNNLTDQIS